MQPNRKARRASKKINKKTTPKKGKIAKGTTALKKADEKLRVEIWTTLQSAKSQDEHRLPALCKVITVYWAARRTAGTAETLTAVEVRRHCFNLVGYPVNDSAGNKIKVATFENMVTRAIMRVRLVQSGFNGCRFSKELKEKKNDDGEVIQAAQPAFVSVLAVSKKVFPILEGRDTATQKVVKEPNKQTKLVPVVESVLRKWYNDAFPGTSRKPATETGNKKKARKATDAQLARTALAKLQAEWLKRIAKCDTGTVFSENEANQMADMMGHIMRIQSPEANEQAVATNLNLAA